MQHLTPLGKNDPIYRDGNMPDFLAFRSNYLRATLNN